MTVTPTVGETYTVDHSDEFNKPNHEFDVTVTMINDGFIQVEAEDEVVDHQVRMGKKNMRKGCGRENTNECYRFVHVEHSGNVTRSPGDHYYSVEEFNDALAE